MPLLKDLEEFKNVSDWIQWAIFIVGVLIAIMAVVSICVSIWLAIKYVKFNRRKNKAGITGSEAARKILDNNDLRHIKVSVVGSLMFGNSYSHFFKKVRLRRLTNKKATITSLAMGAEKSALAILDKNGDKDMKTRITLTPIIFFGPVAFIPLVIIGAFVDFVLLNGNGLITVVCAILGLSFYVVSFILSLMVLKTEVKAQKLACEILLKENLADEEEVDLMKELFKIYNIQYINDLVLEFLELVMRVLMIVAKIQNSSSKND